LLEVLSLGHTKGVGKDALLGLENLHRLDLPDVSPIREIYLEVPKGKFQNLRELHFDNYSVEDSIFQNFSNLKTVYFHSMGNGNRKVNALVSIIECGIRQFETCFGIWISRQDQFLIYKYKQF